MAYRALLPLLALLLLSSVAAAEMYRWVDKNGVVTFKDTPPPVAQRKSRKVKVYKEDDFAAAPTPAPPSPAYRPPRSTYYEKKKGSPFFGTVEIYVTDWCPSCKAAKSYMTRRGIPFVAYDIEKDRSANERFQNLGGRGVPLIIIGSKKMPGFSPQALEYYLSNS